MAEEKKKEDLNYQFVSLVFSLQQAAMAQMGKIANPATGKMEKNLIQAKATIDMLEMLKEKSKGNLTETEQKIVLNTLDNLYLNYADEVATTEGTEKTTEGTEKTTEGTEKTTEGTEKTTESARRNGELEKRGSGDTEKEKPAEKKEEKPAKPTEKKEEKKK